MLGVFASEDRYLMWYDDSGAAGESICCGDPRFSYGAAGAFSAGNTIGIALDLSNYANPALAFSLNGVSQGEVLSQAAYAFTLPGYTWTVGGRDGTSAANGISFTIDATPQYMPYGYCYWTA